MNISDRLETILKMLPEGIDTLADIGTDHGFTVIEALRRVLCKKAIACDIGEGPLSRARDHVSEAGLSDRVDLRLADGLAALSPGEADGIVISGMGGGLICRILEDGFDRIGEEASLVLSPQSELPEFRKWILCNGFIIKQEVCIRDEGKYYFIMLVKKGLESRPYKDYEFAFGRKNLFPAFSIPTREAFLKNEISVKSAICSKLSMDELRQCDRLNELKKDIELAKASL